MSFRIPAMLTVVAAVVACALPGRPAPTATPTAQMIVATSAGPTPTSLPSGSGPCEAQAEVDIPVYTRPSPAADEFGVLSAGMGVTITGLSSDGWLGFDPGVAQAANIGVFRLRWIPAGAELSFTGDCASLPVEPWVPEAGVCYQMSMEPVDVFPVPDPASGSAGTLNVGDFAAVDARTPSGWLLVNGFRANAPEIFGYIPEAAANFDGPCDSIPPIE